jgi:hypothetical protein
MGSLRDIQRQSTLDKRTESALQNFLGLKIFSEWNVFTRVESVFEEIAKEPLADQFIMGPPGSGKTVLSLLTALNLAKEIVSKPNPWEYYDLHPNHNFNIMYLTDDYHTGVFSSHPLVAVVDKIATSSPHFKRAGAQRCQDGYSFLGGSIKLKFESFTRSNPIGTGYITFAVIVDNESSAIKMPPKKPMSPKDFLPEPWQRNIYNTRNLGQYTTTSVSMSSRLKSDLRLLRVLG